MEKEPPTAQRGFFLLSFFSVCYIYVSFRVWLFCLFIIFMYHYMFGCMHVCVPGAWSPEGVRSLGTGVADVCGHCVELGSEPRFSARASVLTISSALSQASVSGV